MQNKFTLDEIDENLKTFYLYWTGEVYDHSMNCFREFEDSDTKKRYLLLKLSNDYIYYDLKKGSLLFTYNADDIAAFIGERFKLYWDGKIAESLTYRKAQATDFLPKIENRALTIKINLPVMDIANNTKTNMTVKISNSQFAVETYENIHDEHYYDSYDICWQEFLLNRYPERYAPIYIDICKKKCKEIESRGTIKKTLFGKKKLVLSEHDKQTLEKLKERLNKAINLCENYYSI